MRSLDPRALFIAAARRRETIPSIGDAEGYRNETWSEKRGSITAERTAKQREPPKKRGKKNESECPRMDRFILGKKNKQINLAIDIYNFIKESFPERIDHASVCEIINVYLSEN